MQIGRGIGVGLLVVGAVAALGAPAAGAVNPPCRMTPREFRNIRLEGAGKRGMTRRFVQQMIGCGGKVISYQRIGGDFSLRQVEYRRTAPVGTVAEITYFNDRVEGKGWYSENGGGGIFPVPIPIGPIPAGPAPPGAG